MACQSRVCTVHKGPPIGAKQQAGVAPLGLYINLLARDPSMARLLNEARAIFGPSGICKWEGLLCPCLSLTPILSVVLCLCMWKLVSRLISLSNIGLFFYLLFFYFLFFYLLFFSRSLCLPQCLSLHFILPVSRIYSIYSLWSALKKYTNKMEGSWLPPYDVIWGAWTQRYWSDK